ncbi:MAG: 1-phosphofructokinase family hexose kinase [Oscillospiraceae bacterium]|nr:1-phosphofructokinase family hexose kinase [Oscillospiraceae bacterium]
MIYTVTLNPSIDYLMYTERFASGAVNRSIREKVNFGGKGLNVSSMLENLGKKSTALGFLGGFTGKEILRLAKCAGINCEFCEISGMSRINVKIYGEEESAINGKGPFITLEEEAALCKKLSALSGDDTVVISGKSAESESGKLLENVLRAAAHTRLVVDMAGEDLTSAIEERPFLIKPNYDEFVSLFGASEMDEETIYRSAEKLLLRGVKNILLSMGERGAMFFSGKGKIYRVRAPKVEVKSTVGAGDSLLAGFLAGYNDGIPLALSLAVAAGSATAGSEGIADGAEVIRFFSEM